MKYRKMLELVRALRSGRFKQTRYSLRNKRYAGYGYCCLGVGCVVAGVKFQPRSSHVVGDEIGTNYMPPKARDYFGMYSNSGSAKDRQDIVVGGVPYDSLASANDKGRTFDEIADAIKANWRRL